MASKLAVVAFGGNALLRPEDRGTQEEQIARAKQAARWLVEIVRHGYKLIVVHGNGPQVGNILIQSEEASTKIPPQTSRSKRHLGTVAMRRPSTQPAYAGISTPWQTLAIGLLAAKKCRVTRTRSLS